MTDGETATERSVGTPALKYPLVVALGDEKVEGADAIGGDKRLIGLGFAAELLVLGDDGGPESLGAFYTVEGALRVKQALQGGAKDDRR